MFSAFLLDLSLAFGSSDSLWSVRFSMIAWAAALGCGLGFGTALVAWARSGPALVSGAERAVPLILIVAGVLFSTLALPHSEYRYEGEDLSFAEAFTELQDGSQQSADPLVGTHVIRKMSRLHLAAILGWQRAALSLGPHLGWDLSPRNEGLPPEQHAPYAPTGPDPPYGWRLVGQATWALAAWFLYGLARRWGAWRSTAALGVTLSMSAPALLFHANCLSDHLAAAVVIVLGLHLQLRRLTEGRMLNGTALLEGLVVLGAAFHTHWTSLFLLAPLALMRLLESSGSLRRQLAHVAGLVAGATAIVLPELSRIVEASKSNLNDMFANYPPEAGLALLSHRHLFANLSPSSLGAFLAPAGEPAFVLLALAGAVALWRSPPPGGRKVLVLVGVTMLGVVVVCFAHIHPGSRWLLPLALWLTLLIARGLQALLTLPQRWRLAGRTAAALLLLGAGSGALGGMEDLRDGWFADAPPAFQQLRSELPEVAMEDLPQLLSQWSGGATVNLIASPKGRWTLTPQVAGPKDPRVLYNPPVMSWSRAFRERPTLYLVGSAEYGWSTNFERDYLTQLSCNFDLQPSFVAGSYVGLVVASPEFPQFPAIPSRHPPERGR